jgi:hypothetical protein
VKRVGFFIYNIYFVASFAAPWTLSPKAAAQLPTLTKQHPYMDLIHQLFNLIVTEAFTKFCHRYCCDDRVDED